MSKERICIIATTIGFYAVFALGVYLRVNGKLW